MHIMLADHHPQALMAIRTILQEKTDFEITGEAMDADKLLAQAEGNPPDLVLMDWQLPGMGIESLITELHKIETKPKVVVMGSNAEQGRKFIKVGADAFISKSDPPDWMLDNLLKYENPQKVR